MRVVHVLSGDLWAGAEAATCHLLAELSRSIEVTAILLNDGELARRLRCEADIEVVVHDESRESFRNLVASVRRIGRTADVVHAHRYKENLLAALSGRPWITTQHGRPERAPGFWRGLQNDFTHKVDQFVKRRLAERVVAVSAEVRDWLVAEGGQRRVTVVPNGIADLAANGPFPPWVDRPKTVGVLARLFPVKGIALAVEAIAAASEVRLEIAGDGPERQCLERIVRVRNCADRVAFLGHVADPRPLVARWRALLVTSFHEGNPISVLEALSLGTPVISAPLRGVEEILLGEGGQVLGGRDPSLWARSIEALVEDEALGSELSRRARQRFECAWSVRRTARAMLQLYCEVASSSHENQ